MEVAERLARPHDVMGALPLRATRRARGRGDGREVLGEGLGEAP